MHTRRSSILAAAAAAGVIATAHGDPKPPKAAAWSRVHFESEPRAKAAGPHMSIDVYPDGRVIFANGGADLPEAATVAKAPQKLLDQIGAWAATGPAAGPAKVTTDYVVDVDLDVGGKTRKKATYPSDKIPADESALFGAVGELINTPRTPMPCPAWDGKGAFTLTLVSQDFGYVPGPVSRITIASDGTASRAGAGGASGAKLEVKKTAKATSAEIDALRAALVTIDLGHFTDVYGGAGEGSNLRLVHLQTTAGACGRAFTNAWADGMKPLGLAIAPITKRLQ